VRVSEPRGILLLNADAARFYVIRREEGKARSSRG
jgi:hypothetical protein